MAAAANERFYERELPEAGDLAVVKVSRLENNMGAYVSLLEYGRVEGLILPTELSKRRFRSISKIIRVGRQEVVMVVRVDPEKGYVDLSKKRVSPEDIGATEERFSKSKKVYLTARQVATKLDMEVSEVNRVAIWPLYKKYPHAFDGLKEACEDAEKAFEGIDCPIELRDALVADMKTRLTPTAVKVRVRVHVSCTGEQGVLAVKEALLAAQNAFAGTNVDLNVHLMAPPLYMIVATSYDKSVGMKSVEEALRIIKEKITSVSGGDFNQQGEIVCIGADEDTTKLDEDSEDESDSDDSDESGSGDSDEEDEDEEDEDEE